MLTQSFESIAGATAGRKSVSRRKKALGRQQDSVQDSKESASVINMLTPAGSLETMLEKKRNSNIPSLLENLHQGVAKVNMVGLNSNTQYSIDFVADPRGIQQ